MKPILYIVAIDKTEKLIKANDAEKGNKYYCPVCKGEMILRKSGNSKKGSKRPHFAHQVLTPNCTPETALHYAFKNLLAEKIKIHFDTNQPLMFFWRCKYCGDLHSGNLLKKITSVKLEYNLTVCQPDIALLDDENKVFAVIEVVVTHEPEETVLNFYKENNIILIQINLNSDADIDNLDELISNPTIVDICFNPKCKICGNFQQKKIMTIIDGPCWKCGATMKVSVISSSNQGMIRNGSSHLGPSQFSISEIEFAKAKGVFLKQHYSKTENERYLANTCQSCGSFAGDYYLFTQYVAPTGYGKFPYKSFDIGYICENCEEERFVDEDDY